jgi:hypothetical protein
MDYAVITQKVDCVFGHDDHLITVTITDDRTLKTITSTCSADREETDGLILLGTDPMKTCLGYIDCFLKHAKNETSGYDLSNLYKNTFLYFAGSAVATTNKEKRDARLREQAETKAKLEKEKGHDVVSRRLQEILEGTAGIGHQTAAYMRVRKAEDTGKYTFYTGTGSEYSYTTRLRGPENWVPVATRQEGVWVLRHDWETCGAHNTVSSWGGECAFCHLDGHRDHSDKKGHRRKFTKALMIGLQATGQAGMRLMKEGLTDKNGDALTFKYRKNSKQVMGVRVEEAPCRVYNEDTMEFHDAPANPSYER